MYVSGVSQTVADGFPGKPVRHGLRYTGDIHILGLPPSYHRGPQASRRGYQAVRQRLPEL